MTISGPRALLRPEPCRHFVLKRARDGGSSRRNLKGPWRHGSLARVCDEAPEGNHEIGRTRALSLPRDRPGCCRSSEIAHAQSRRKLRRRSWWSVPRHRRKCPAPKTATSEQPAFCRAALALSVLIDLDAGVANSEILGTTVSRRTTSPRRRLMGAGPRSSLPPRRLSGPRPSNESNPLPWRPSSRPATADGTMAA